MPEVVSCQPANVEVYLPDASVFAGAACVGAVLASTGVDSMVEPSSASQMIVKVPTGSIVNVPVW